ncbi:MAG: cobalamin biosynthesis protein CobD [Lachnospiraceae bacterium]|nr:cobalamin biosynthesis protein CobD [Lachnospiraceae bacterium]
MLFIAAAVDLIVGDPHGLWHPVQGIGSLISVSERFLRSLFAVPPRQDGDAGEGVKIRERIAGILMVFLVLLMSTAAVLFLLKVCGRIHLYLRLLAEGILCGRLLALRSLGEAGFSVRDPLLQNDIEGARKTVSMIVGRDTDRLDEEGIARAAVETVAENTSDGVTAPLFYMILFGGIGGIFYKAVNTMDSMTGYKNARYRYFGTAAARLDDVMNFIPARLTALIMILACYLPGKETACISAQAPPKESKGPKEPKDPKESKESREPESAETAGKKAAAEGGSLERDSYSRRVLLPDGAEAFRIWRRDRLKSPSPNSAQTESVCAGALHLRLLGDTWYFGELHHKQEIGDGGRKTEPADITRTVRLMNRTAFLMFALGIAVLALAGLF